VHAAAGGVGLLLCQIARRRGARIIGTVSTEAKAELARQAGAHEVILYTQQDFQVETMRLTGQGGVDVVYDSVGRTTFAQGLGCLAPRGMMVLYGQSSGPVPAIDPQILNQKGSLFLTRPSLGHYVSTRAELLERASALLAWVADGSLKVRIGHEFPLAAAAEAHAQLEGRRTTGKVLLIP
jgi:NADPH2:quinone reductase